MPDSYNKYDIDEQFTDKAWVDMKGRLDKALPIKQPIFLNRWLALAAILCLFCIGGYWFTSSDTNAVLENTNSKTTVETLANEITSKLSDEKNNSIPPPVTSKSNLTVNQPTENKALKSLQSNTESAQHPSLEKSQQSINAANKNIKTTNSLNILKHNTRTVQNNRSTIINNDPDESRDLNNTKKSKPTLSKAKDLVNKDKGKLLKQKSSQASKPHTSKFKITTFNKRSIEYIKHLVTIDGNLHPSPKLAENTLMVNQSSTGKFNDQELITQKNDDEWLHPKTIHYGIKQGLSSDLTSESKIFAGALVDFNFGKRWFIELAPMYQYGAINKKLELQYDTAVAASEVSRDDPKDIDLPSGEPGEMPTTIPGSPSIEPGSEYIYSKDTILKSFKANGHYVAADMLFGYRISPRFESLLGFSVGRCFSNCPENTNAGLQEFNASVDSEQLYNNWSLSPKVALRFALKPKFSVETSYAYNLIPAVKEEFQLDKAKTNASASNSSNYFSSNFGLAFVYKFK